MFSDYAQAVATHGVGSKEAELVRQRLNGPDLEQLARLADFFFTEWGQPETKNPGSGPLPLPGLSAPCASSRG